MNLDRVTSGRDLPNDFNVIIEIPMHADPVKYEVDKETGALFVDRFMMTAMRYPCNYGYIPHTLSDDGDPADVLVIAPFPVNVGAVIRCWPFRLTACCPCTSAGTRQKTCNPNFWPRSGIFSSTTKISKRASGSKSPDGWGPRRRARRSWRA